MSNPKTELLFLGSSHFSQRRKFKTLLQDVRMPLSITNVRISSCPGGFLNQKVINLAHDHVRKSYPYTQVLIVIMLACNGIRHDPKNNNMEAMHKKLVKTLGVYETVRFVFCGCIPSPFKLQDYGSGYMSFNKFAFNFHKENKDKVYFFDTADLFYGKKGLKQFLFDLDGVHLNREGAHLLVMTLHTFICHSVLPHWNPLSTPYPRSLILETGCTQN